MQYGLWRCRGGGRHLESIGLVFCGDVLCPSPRTTVRISKQQLLYVAHVLLNRLHERLERFERFHPLCWSEDGDRVSGFPHVIVLL